MRTPNIIETAALGLAATAVMALFGAVLVVWHGQHWIDAERARLERERAALLDERRQIELRAAQIVRQGLVVAACLDEAEALAILEEQDAVELRAAMNRARADEEGWR